MSPAGLNARAARLPAMADTSVTSSRARMDAGESRMQARDMSSDSARASESTKRATGGKGVAWRTALYCCAAGRRLMVLTRDGP